MTSQRYQHLNEADRSLGVSLYANWQVCTFPCDTSRRSASFTSRLVGMLLRTKIPCFTLQLPIEDLCSLSSRSLQSPFTATVPASTEDVLRKGFQMLDMENDRIETAQQVTVASVNGNFNAATLAFCSKQYACVSMHVAVFCLVRQVANKHGPG